MSFVVDRVRLLLERDAEIDVVNQPTAQFPWIGGWLGTRRRPVAHKDRQVVGRNDIQRRVTWKSAFSVLPGCSESSGGISPELNALKSAATLDSIWPKKMAERQ